MSGNVVCFLNDPSSIDPLSTQSIYIHIPFCTKKCPYCHFYVVRDTTDKQKDELLEALIRELYLVQPTFEKGKKIVSIYWGGGTPSLFGPERIQAFHEKIYSLFSDEIAPDIEITIEANPDSLTEKALQEYGQAGINRLSLGAQSFLSSELEILGRNHSGKAIFQAIDWAYKAGINNISIDLMYDLPDQSCASWKQNLITAFSLPITHLSLYNLTIEPKTYFFRMREALEKKRPSEEVSRDMYIIAQEMAQKYGFQQYEISAFAKPGFFSRHNTGYWNGRDFYGLGPSAYSFMNNTRFSNFANINRYIQNIKNEKLEYDEVDSVLPEGRVRELFCIGLRLFSGISLKTLLSKYSNLTLSPVFYAQLNYMIEEGLISRFYHDESKTERYRLTERGALLHNLIASELI